MKNNDLKARRIAHSVLVESGKKNNRITDELNSQFDGNTLSDQDRRFITELVNGTTRMQGRLDSELMQIYKGNYSKLQLDLKTLLRLAAYQISMMDRVPDYAAVSTAVSLAKEQNSFAGKLTNGILRNYLRHTFEAPAPTASLTDKAAWLSHPRWLLDKWAKQWSWEAAADLATWNNTVPGVWFRLNAINYTAGEFEEYCASNRLGVEQIEGVPNYYRVKESGQLLQSELFKSGKLSIQDPAGGLIIQLLKPAENECITDGCAAPGGKATALAQLVGNKGSITAYDNNANRLSKVTESVNRLGLTNLKTEVKDLTRDKLESTDKLLLDVPCSGTGVMAKRADIRWRRNHRQLREFTRLQSRILQNASKHVNAGGVLVYSTCSLEPEENWQIIESFLKGNPDYKIEPAQNYVDDRFCDEKGALFTFPPRHKIDGGYAVRLRNL